MLQLYTMSKLHIIYLERRPKKPVIYVERLQKPKHCPKQPVIRIARRPEEVISIPRREHMQPEKSYDNEYWPSYGNAHMLPNNDTYIPELSQLHNNNYEEPIDVFSP